MRRLGLASKKRWVTVHLLASFISPDSPMPGPPSMPSPVDWFRDVPWTLPLERQDHLVPALSVSRPKLLGGSSKLAKLAEERRKKAAAAAGASPANDALSSLDRLTKPKDAKEHESRPAVIEPRSYPIRKKREPTPPPREPVSYTHLTLPTKRIV